MPEAIAGNALAVEAGPTLALLYRVLLDAKGVAEQAKKPKRQAVSGGVLTRGNQELGNPRHTRDILSSTDPGL